MALPAVSGLASPLDPALRHDPARGRASARPVGGQPALAAAPAGPMEAPPQAAAQGTPWPQRLRRLALAWPFPIALLLAWQLAADNEWIPPQILPAPSVVAQTFLDLFESGELQDHTLISLGRVLYGFALGSGAGLLLGVAMGLSTTAKEFLYPTFKIFAQVPSLGWLPLLMMVLGIDEALKIVLISKAALVPLAMSTYNGLRGVPNRYIEIAKVYGFNRRQLLQKVVFPAALPPIWNGLRYGLTHAWLALVAVELLASSEGLGFLIVYGRQLYQLDVVLAAVIVVGSVGLLLDKLLALIESRLLRWRVAAF